MRTIKEAARAAIAGHDAVLLDACWQIAAEQGCQAKKLMDADRCEMAISLMGVSERILYGITLHGAQSSPMG